MRFKLVEDLKIDKLEDIIFQEFNKLNTPTEGPMYIAPSGYFISLFERKNMGPEDFPAHSEIEYYLNNLGISDRTGGATDGSPTLRDNGFIRLNSGDPDNTYIELSDKRPTFDQYEALETWLDFIQPTEWVALCTPQMREYQQYYFKEYTTDDIIKRIKRYYTSGKLYEGKTNAYTIFGRKKI